LGNSSGGDDGVGLRLAELLLKSNMRNVAVLGLQPDLSLSHANVARAAHVVFLDATDFGAQPGAVTFLDAARIESRFPQLSTHRIALSTIARLLLNRGIAGVWLMGIQPGSLCPRRGLTPAVQTTVELLAHLIVRCFTRRPSGMTMARIQPPQDACESMSTVETSPS
jgi:hydrogenase maturation protease